MLEALKERLKSGNKKTMANLITVFAIGIGLIAVSNLFLKEGETPENNALQTAAAETEPAFSQNAPYEQALENRLAALFKNVEGAGNVSVMLTISSGREIIVAEDNLRQSSYLKETEAGGASREEQEESVSQTKIILNGGGGGSPLVLKELEPKVEGVIIVAEGGGDIYVKDALIRATQALLGIEPHKVQVLKMKPRE